MPNGTYKLYLVDSSTNSNNLHIPQLYPNTECNACFKLAIQGSGDNLIIDDYNAINNINFDMNLGASISGKIIDAITGDALPNFASFLVFDELNNLITRRLIFGTNIIPATTGDYTVGGLLPGSYYLQGGDAGLDFYQREVYNNKPCYWSGCDRSTGVPIVLGVRQAVNNIDFLLERGGKISGTIISTTTGFPIADANVQVQFLDSNEVVVGGARTKSDGTYISARALPAGDYSVRTGNLFAGILTQPYVNEKYDNIVCSGLACDLTTADVNVTVDNVTANIDFALDVGLSFSGTITESVTGNPIPDVHVLVYKDMGDGTVKFANWATTSNGSDAAIGEFEVSGLPLGTYYAVTNNGSNLPFLGYRPAPGLGWLDILYDGMICPAAGCDIIQGTPIVMTNTKSADKSANTTINLTLQ
ncbi:MAG: carboxypeptidase-like regulatory domain-containing protein [Proteobacteria bacterium]|nr:carboxypeptidase-like regulatory domain-containing protein [Pseudomonadota bacterium]